MPRPTKLTPDVQDAICKALASGNTRKAAYQYAGISHEAFSNWLQKAAAANAPEIYRAFGEAVKKAEADAQVRNVALIQKAASDTWTAAAWWLERRYPDEWGKVERLNIGNADGKPFQIAWPKGGADEQQQAAGEYAAPAPGTDDSSDAPGAP